MLVLSHDHLIGLLPPADTLLTMPAIADGSLARFGPRT
jgi:hypothetical protein